MVCALRWQMACLVDGTVWAPLAVLGASSALAWAVAVASMLAESDFWVLRGSCWFLGGAKSVAGVLPARCWEPGDSLSCSAVRVPGALGSAGVCWGLLGSAATAGGAAVVEAASVCSLEAACGAKSVVNSTNRTRCHEEQPVLGERQVHLVSCTSSRSDTQLL